MPLDPDFAALAQPVAAAAAIPQSAGGSLDPDFAALASPPQAKTTQAAPILGPWASALVRPLAKGVAGLPLMAMDAGVASRNLLGDAYNKATGSQPTPDYELPSSMFNRTLDSYTQAPTGIGKGAEFVSSMVAGSRLPMPSAPEVPGAAAQAAYRVASGLTGAQQHAMEAGAPLGFRVTPGQQLGSVPLRQLEARLESQPLTSGPFAALKHGNQAALDRQAALSIGEDAPNVDATVLGRANERLGKAFEDARSPNRIVLPDPSVTTTKLDQIDESLEGLVPEGTTIRSNPLVARLESLTQSGGINGQQLGQISSKLGKAAFKQMTSPSGDRDMGLALYAAKDHADDLLQSAMSPQDASAYAAARSQYRNLMNLTSRVGIVNPSTGSVSGANLANRLQQVDKQGFLYGKNQSDLYNSVRFAQAFKPLVGDSGTATRSSHGLLSNVGPLVGGLLGGAAGHASGHGAVEGAGVGAAAMSALPYLASRAYLSRPALAALQGARALPGVIRPALPRALAAGLLTANDSE